MAITDWRGFQRQQAASVAVETPSGGFLRWLSERATAWEDWITYGIAMLVFLSVAESIQNAEWVTGMPLLSIVGFLGITVGMLLARSSINQFLAHLLSLVIGAAVVFWQGLTVVNGSSPGARIDDLYLRMEHFFDIALSGLISRDDLPFILLVVGLTWPAAYFFSWAVFRWNNAWLGLIPAGIGLFANFFYFQDENFSFLFIVFAFSSLLLVMRVNLMRRIRQWQKEGTRYPEFISLSFLHLTSWAALFMLLFAWILPAGGATSPFTGLWDQVTRPFEGTSSDFGRLFVQVQTRQVRPIHSFEDFLPFKDSVPQRERVVLQVRTDELPGVAPYLLLSGAAYNRYTSAGWLMGDRITAEIPGITPDAAKQALTGSEALGKRVPTEAEVTIVGSRRSVVFSIGQPLAASVPSVYDVLRPTSGRGATSNPPLFLNGLALQSKEVLAEGSTYQSVGTIPNVTADDLRKAGTSYPAFTRDLYLQLPSELPERVKNLAREITAGAATDYDKALAIEDYLRRVYPKPVYKVPEVPVGRDTVDYFLFDSRQGFFDYYASAMVVMLRSLGIPSRLAVGFLLDEKSVQDGSLYIVRDRHAYAWAEVYFPGVGWTQFNPSPDKPPLGGATIRDLTNGTATGPEEDPFAQDDPIVPEEEPITDPSVASDVQTDSGTPMAVWIALAVMGALALLAAGGYFAWERSMAGLPYPQRIWEKTVRLASWAGARPRPSQTPHEFIKDVSALTPDVSDTSTLADAYGRSRFGNVQPSEEEERSLREVWEQLRNKLVARVLRWK